CRTAAPMRRSGSQLVGVEVLPPATCRPYLASSRSACSMRTSFQSTSSSSARSIGRCVFTPWPTSGFFERMVTTPSDATLMKATVSKAMAGAAAAPDAACATAAAVAAGFQQQATSTPPPASELTFRKDRRSRAAVCIGHLRSRQANPFYRSDARPQQLVSPSNRLARRTSASGAARNSAFVDRKNLLCLPDQGRSRSSRLLAVLGGGRHFRKGEEVAGRIAHADFARAIEGLAFGQVHIGRQQRRFQRIEVVHLDIEKRGAFS